MKELYRTENHSKYKKKKKKKSKSKLKIIIIIIILKNRNQIETTKSSGGFFSAGTETKFIGWCPNLSLESRRKQERKKERRKEGRKKRSIQVSETKTKQKKKELWLKQHSGFINKE